MANFLGDKLRNLRAMKRYGITDLASLSNIHPSRIDAAEHGDFEPSDDELMTLAICLDANVEELLKLKRAFKKGKPPKHDNWFGINEPDFWNWWHRGSGGKKVYGHDIRDRDEAKRFYKEWEDAGKPVVFKSGTDDEDDESMSGRS